jgi:hypothetical protein
VSIFYLSLSFSPSFLRTVARNAFLGFLVEKKRIYSYLSMSVGSTAMSSPNGSSKILNKRLGTVAQSYIPIIFGRQRSGELVSKASLGKMFMRPPSPPMTRHGGAHLSS